MRTKNYVEECQNKIDKIAEEIDSAAELNQMDEYLKDYLDITYIVNADKKYEDARIYITLQGPTIWIDTEIRKVVWHDQTCQVEAFVSDDALDKINELCEMWYHD